MKHLLRILPAIPASSIVQPHVQCSDSRAKKRKVLLRACNACRKIKCKCDGVRPRCVRCVERKTGCVYDTEEGKSRTASLRDTNKLLQAKIDSYEEVFQRLLDAGLNKATRDRLIEIMPPSQHNPRQEISAGNYSLNGIEPSSSNDSIHAQNPSVSHLGRSPFARQDTYQGCELFPSNDQHLDWRSVGCDPKNGRISGRQQGWHPILVVRQPQEVETVMNSYEPQEGQFRQPYGRSLGTFVYGQLEHEGDDSDVEKLVSEHWLQNQKTDTWQFDDLNDISFTTSFLPPPGAVTAYGNLPMSSAILANGYPLSTQRRQLLNFRVPEHTIPPLLVEENSDMSRIYIDFKDAALQLIGNRASASEILGSSDTVFIDLYIRNRLPGDAYTICNWACELVKQLPEFDVFVQVAWIALLARLMRWIIHPTADNYPKVPSMIRPVKAQRLIPHSPAIDLCPHPAFREALMLHYRDWITPSQIGRGWLTCWDKDLDLVMEVCPHTGNMMLRAEFEQETQSKDAWTIDDEILSSFPDAPGFGLKTRNRRFSGSIAKGKTREVSG